MTDSDRLAQIQRRFFDRVDQVVPSGDPSGFAEPVEFPIIRDAIALARAVIAERDALAEAVETYKETVTFAVAQRDELRATVHAAIARGDALTARVEVARRVCEVGHTAAYDLRADVLAALASPESETNDG